MLCVIDYKAATIYNIVDLHQTNREEMQISSQSTSFIKKKK